VDYHQRNRKIKKNETQPVPPDEILNEEFFEPLGLMANALAKPIGMPAQPDHGDSEE
jgi:hypothetical protein